MCRNRHAITVLGMRHADVVPILPKTSLDRCASAYRCMPFSRKLVIVQYGRIIGTQFLHGQSRTAFTIGHEVHHMPPFRLLPRKMELNALGMLSTARIDVPQGPAPRCHARILGIVVRTSMSMT